MKRTTFCKCANLDPAELSKDDVSSQAALVEAGAQIQSSRKHFVYDYGVSTEATPADVVVVV